MSRMSVDLPDPLAPSTPWIPPRSTRIDTSLIATTGVLDRPTAKDLLTRSTSSAGTSAPTAAAARRAPGSESNDCTPTVERVQPASRAIRSPNSCLDADRSAIYAAQTVARRMSDPPNRARDLAADGSPPRTGCQIAARSHHAPHSEGHVA